MSREKPLKPDVVTYSDHEVITPDTRKLRRAVRAASASDPDPVAAAEQALEQISTDFAVWMLDECERLDTARRKIKQTGLTPQTKQELFLSAHDLKGDSATFGYPEVGPVADSLCRLLEHSPKLDKVPMSIIDQHVDAVRAIVREHQRTDATSIAIALNQKLRAVTDEFLVKENWDRPEVLQTIKSPTLVPGESF